MNKHSYASHLPYDGVERPRVINSMPRGKKHTGAMTEVSCLASDLLVVEERSKSPTPRMDELMRRSNLSNFSQISSTPSGKTIACKKHMHHIQSREVSPTPSSNRNRSPSP
jgi:hypothetical protein